VFPEGTRTPADGVIRLKRGAANIAVRGVRNITPVLIRCQPPTLGKGDKWWHVPECVVQFQIEVQDDLEIENFIGGTEVMAARALTAYLQQYFTEKHERHA
jgi:1-acyl-sn-glycerol-3-phosphate acyltransferase